jgi:hypothetical protein
MSNFSTLRGRDKKVVSPPLPFKEIKTMEQITLKDLNKEFSGFTGTENYYKHWLSNFVFTDGIKAAVDKFSSYWLLDTIFCYQYKSRIKEETFQIWTITSENSKAVVEMRPDTDKPAIVRQEIPLTTFPEGKLKIYFIDDGNYKVLLLPSEY